jgi:type IV secretory pathway VirB4 component
MEESLLMIPGALVGAAALGAHLVTRLERGTAEALRARSRLFPLAQELPYWDIDPEGVILGVDLSYSAVLELGGVDTDCLDDEALGSVARHLHALLAPLRPGVHLQWTCITDRDHTATLDRFRSGQRAEDAVGQRLAQEKVASVETAGWLRRTRLYLVCTTDRPAGRGRKQLGPSRRFIAQALERHAAERERVLGLRRELARSLESAALRARPLDGAQTRALIYELLNPGRHQLLRTRREQPLSAGRSLSAYFDGMTAREELAQSTLVEDARLLRLDGKLLRVVSLRTLPLYTTPALLERLTVSLPYPARVQMALETLEQQSVLDRLKRRRDQAHMHATRSERRNQEAEVAERDVEQIIERALSSSVRIVRVAVTVVLEVDERAPDAERQLDQQTSEVLRLFASMNGAEGRVEEYSQLDGWLSTLPAGAGHQGGGHAARWHTVTSENAAHMALAFQSWAGHETARVLFENGRNYLVGLDPFDASLPGPNGFVAGSTGSGKSTTTNYLLMHLLASGARALIVDVGGSYRRLIELFGGQYLSFEKEADAALNLFYPPAEMLLADASPDPLRMQFVLTVLEVLLQGPERPALRNDERAVLERAVRAIYAGASEAPILSDLEQALQAHAWADEEDRQIARALARGLRFWTQGASARLLNRRSTIQLTSDLAAFDLKGLPRTVQPAVVLILAAIIWNLVMRDRNERKVVVFDEVWTLLDDPASVRLLAELYRTARKYRASILAISQSVEDLTRSSVASALVQNSHTRYLLKHEMGHADVAEVFGLNDRELEVFRGLEKRHGEYSEILVCAGKNHFLARVVLTPLEYWIATTDPRDLAAIEEVHRAHPGASTLGVIETCAARWPRGVSLAEGSHVRK